MLSSLSGGTDVCSGFVGGSPLTPVWEGEISCRYLGAAVAAHDESGRPVSSIEGELVITQPMPSMPLRLWGDRDGSRYRATYFGDTPGVWRHGDRITITDRGSCVISGRSDATLNRGGVRIGTAELYRVIESQPGVRDSLVVHLSHGDALLLLVALDDAAELDERDLRVAIRSQLSPRHVPDEIHRVRAIPTTMSGKKLEIPVKRLLSGESLDPATLASVRDPASLADIVALAQRRGRQTD
jgi:acetoacetyl-CoA synthetase